MIKLIFLKERFFMGIGKDTVKFYLDWEESEEKGVALENKVMEYINEHGNDGKET